MPENPLDYFALIINPDGTAQTDFRRKDDVLTSFDPAQLPKLFTQLLGEVHGPLLTSLEVAKAQRDANAAEVEARGADIDGLMVDLNEAKYKLARAEAALTVPVELIESLGLLPDLKPVETGVSDQVEEALTLPASAAETGESK